MQPVYANKSKKYNLLKMECALSGLMMEMNLSRLIAFARVILCYVDTEVHFWPSFKHNIKCNVIIIFRRFAWHCIRWTRNE